MNKNIFLLILKNTLSILLIIHLRVNNYNFMKMLALCLVRNRVKIPFKNRPSSSQQLI